MKPIKGYLIDPATRTIVPAKYSGDFEHINSLIGSHTFDLVRFDGGDGMFVDDDGLAKMPYNFFGFRGYANPLAGKGLILGSNAEGESTAPAYPIAYYKARLVWCEVLFKGVWGVTMGRKTRLMSLGAMQDFLSRPIAD